MVSDSDFTTNETCQTMVVASTTAKSFVADAVKTGSKFFSASSANRQGKYILNNTAIQITMCLIPLHQSDRASSSSSFLSSPILLLLLLLSPILLLLLLIVYNARVPVEQAQKALKQAIDAELRVTDMFNTAHHSIKQTKELLTKARSNLEKLVTKTYQERKLPITVNTYMATALKRYS
jgi:hypothetical protein